MAGLVKKLNTDNLMIVDAMNLCFRWKPFKPSEKVASFAGDFCNTVESLARSYDCGNIVVAADMKGSRYRREIFPDYKGNRKTLTENQTEDEKIQIEAFFAEYEKTLELADKHFTVLRYEGVEADDIAAYICKMRSDYGFDKIWLISSDRDWDLLINEDVSRFSTVTRKEVTLDTWPYEVPPEQYLCYKCLTGDKGDNIPGVPKVGPKTAAKLLSEYGSSFDICDAIPLPGKYVYIQNLNASKEQILLNHELMDLVTYCEEAIGSDNLRDIGMELMKLERKKVYG